MSQRPCHADLATARPIRRVVVNIERSALTVKGETFIAAAMPVGFLRPMARWSERLRKRARELGLADAEVARRLGLDQSRYSAYVNGRREPDFALLLRICGVLGTSPDWILGVEEQPRASRPAMERLMAAAEGLDDATIETAAVLVRALGAHVQGRDQGPAG